MLVNLYGFLIWKCPLWISVSIDWTWVWLRINKWVSESCFIWWVMRMVVWMSLWLSSSTISSRSWIQRVVGLWNVNSVKSSWCHSLRILINFSSCKNIPTLLSESFLKKLISCHVWNISLVAWDYHIFALDRLSLLAHIVIWSSIHIIRGPLEKVIFSNWLSSFLVCWSKLVFRLS